VLDAGCGSGLFAIELARYYPQLRISGCDLDITRASRFNMDSLPLVTFFQAYLTEFSTEERYDFVYCLDVLDDIPQYDRALEKLVDVLRPGGYIYIHLPLHPRRIGLLNNRAIENYVNLDNQNSLGRDIDEPKLLALLNGCGVTIVRQGYSIGYVGTLAWEMGRLIEKSLILRLSVTPILKLLAWYDCHRINKIGNAFFVLGRKAPSP